MTVTEISSKKKWDQVHLSLNSALAKEIHLMREVLANLHQEELSLLEHDMRRWKRITRERSDLIVQLSKQRSKRMAATVDLTKLAVIHEKTEMLPHEEEASCEILSKLDQVMALLDRINLQNCRNDALFDQAKHKKNLPLSCPVPHPLHSTRRKTSVATFMQKD